MSNVFGLSKVKNIIAISSCKGGVGKSTMAAGIAWELKHRGFNIGLLDADIHGPSLPTLFALKDPEVAQDEFKLIAPVDCQGLKLMSFGFLLGDEPAVMRGPIVTRYIQQLLFQVNWGELDYLVLDMPPGTGDVQLTITQSIKLNGALIVTTPQTLSLVDVSRGIIMFEKVNVPILGIIENMAYFLCDGCGKRHEIFGRGKLQERFGVKTVAQVPLRPSLAASMEKYTPDQSFKEAVDGMLDALKDLNLLENMTPKAAFDGKQLTLTWTDGRSLTLPHQLVRANCRCAVCIDEMSGKPLYDPKRIPVDVVPQEITPLGNYALAISWNDGHSSGIYPYAMLQELGKMCQPNAS